MKARNENLLGRLQNLPPATATAIGLLYLAAVGIADFYMPVGDALRASLLIRSRVHRVVRGLWLAFAGAVLACGVSIAARIHDRSP